MSLNAASLFLREPIYEDQTITIRLDASTVCQLRCPSCSTAKGLIDGNLGSKTLKFEDFKKIVDRNPWVRGIELSNWGEIFLNRDLLKIAEYAL